VLAVTGILAVISPIACLAQRGAQLPSIRNRSGNGRTSPTQKPAASLRSAASLHRHEYFTEDVSRRRRTGAQSVVLLESQKPATGFALIY
jgi:hypothetical protein